MVLTQCSVNISLYYNPISFYSWILECNIKSQHRYSTCFKVFVYPIFLVSVWLVGCLLMIWHIPPTCTHIHKGNSYHMKWTSLLVCLFTIRSEIAMFPLVESCQSVRIPVLNAPWLCLLIFFWRCMWDSLAPFLPLSPVAVIRKKEASKIANQLKKTDFQSLKFCF